ncbi:MAG: MSCRAMM family protein, partial [Blastocatellia bacterium]
MAKQRFTLVILGSLFSLCLGVSIQAQPGETKAETATVSGLVTLKGEPARGVTVQLQQINSGSPISPRVRTDENGRFRFNGVTAGRYSILAVTPGYVSLGDDDGLRFERTLNVSEGEKVEGINFDLKRGGVIAGRVIDSQGRPLIEESVHLQKLDKDGKPQNSWRNNLNYLNYEMYRTDDRGAYRIYGLPEGRYRVSVGLEHKPGSVAITSSRQFYPRVYHPDATSESEAKAIEVSEGSEATDIDITVSDPKQTCDVYGRVVDADTGQPVAGVEIVVGGVSQEGKLSGGYAGTGERSKPNGEFRLMGVAPGRYAVLVRPDPKNDSGYISDPVVFDLSEGDATGVEVKVRQGASISG